MTNIIVITAIQQIQPNSYFHQQLLFFSKVKLDPTEQDAFRPCGVTSLSANQAAAEGLVSSKFKTSTCRLNAASVLLASLIVSFMLTFTLMFVGKDAKYLKDST